MQDKIEQRAGMTGIWPQKQAFVGRLLLICMMVILIFD